MEASEEGNDEAKVTVGRKEATRKNEFVKDVMNIF